MLGDDPRKPQGGDITRKLNFLGLERMGWLEPQFLGPCKPVMHARTNEKRGGGMIIASVNLLGRARAHSQSNHAY